MAMGQQGKKTYMVHFEPVGVEMEVEEGETVLNAAFRQGIMLMHGCKEGQCSSCKSILLEGDVELLKYSTFALPDYEREQEYVLLCRTQAYSDLVIELLSYDEELLLGSLPVKEYAGRVTALEALTHDIYRLEVMVDQPLTFWAGHYVDITIPDRGVTRSYSMANPPSEPHTLEFIIKVYPDGAFSSLLRDQLQVGDALQIKGPYGACFRREQRSGLMILVGGGSGMAPLWSILNDFVAHGDHSQPVLFFYGARAERDLFYLDKIAAIGQQLPNFRFVPALSHLEPDASWEGERGFIHEVVNRYLKAEAKDGEMVAYACGPPPMIDAVLPVLERNGVKPSHIYVDRFTQATG
jgi:propane monooxygenase reductase subunit